MIEQIKALDAQAPVVAAAYQALPSGSFIVASDRAVPQIVSYTVNSMFLHDPDFEWETAE